MLELFGQIGPVLLIGLIAGLVEFAKKFGLAGNYCIALSMALALAFGTGYQLTQAIPVDVAGWFTLVVFDLLFGLMTCGLYDIAKQFRPTPPTA